MAGGEHGVGQIQAVDTARSLSFSWRWLVPDEQPRPVLHRYFEDSVTYLRSQYERSAGQRASRNLGDNRETFCNDFLSRVLPPRLSIGRGEILDSRGARTGQLDTVVIRQDCPKLDFGGADTYLAEGVFAVIETKSVLNRAKVREALTTLRAVRDLHLDYGPHMANLGPAPLERPLRCIFAYGLESLAPVAEEMLDPQNRDVADIVSILGWGIFVANGHGIEDTGSPLPYVLMPGSAASLGILYLLFVRYASRFLGRVINFNTYFDPLEGWFEPFGPDDPRRATLKQPRRRRAAKQPPSK